MKIVPLILVLSWTLSVTLGCSCIQNHLQHLFCSVDFVIHGFPFAEHASDMQKNYRTYSLLIFAVYRGKSGKLQPYTIKNATTEFHGATCGVHLISYIPYLLEGFFNKDGMMELRLCQINKPYNNLNHCQLNGIRGYYGYIQSPNYDCSCRIKPCFGTDCPADQDECVYNHHTRKHNTDFCKRSHDGLCRWKSCSLN